MLTPEQKCEVHKIFDSYIKWLQDNHAWDHTVHAVKGIVDYMDSADHRDLIPEFKNLITKIDTIREESLLEIYPELKPLWT
jgi:hypothetical protein